MYVCKSDEFRNSFKKNFLRGVFAAVVVILELPKGGGTENLVRILSRSPYKLVLIVVILKLVVNFETVVIPVYK